MRVRCDGEQVLQMGELALNMPVPTHVTRYVAELIVASHPEHETASEPIRRYVRYGASPRGAQALIMGAKIHALLEGRFNVSFDDISAVALAGLRHRILLNFEGMAEGISSDEIILSLLKSVQKVRA